MPVGVPDKVNPSLYVVLLVSLIYNILDGVAATVTPPVPDPPIDNEISICCMCPLPILLLPILLLNTGSEKVTVA